MKRIYFAFIAYLLFVILPLLSSAQKEGDNWTFADSMGLKFDVENDTLSLYKTFIPYLSSGEIECQATISDSLGNLLFYLKPGVNGLPDNNDTFNIYLRGGGKGGRQRTNQQRRQSF